MTRPQSGWIRRTLHRSSSYGALGALVMAFAASCSGNSDDAPPVNPKPDAPSVETPDAAPDTTTMVSNDATPADRSENTVDVVDTGANVSEDVTTADMGPRTDGAPTGSDARSDANGSDANTVRDASSMSDGPVFTGMARIMVLGSSNESDTCWRAYLWRKLRAGGITNWDYVGSQVVGPDCGVPGYTKACEARSGTNVAAISAATYRSWFAANPPDIVLQHNGGADIMAGTPPADVIRAYTTIVTQARSVNPKVIFLVAQHTPMTPAGCGNCVPNTLALNNAIPGWAAMTTTNESPILVVDLYNGLDPVADFPDRVHLNTSGSEKVSDKFMAALLPILKP